MAEQEKGLAKEEQADTWTGQKPGIPRERGDHEGTYMAGSYVSEAYRLEGLNRLVLLLFGYRRNLASFLRLICTQVLQLYEAMSGKVKSQLNN